MHSDLDFKLQQLRLDALYLEARRERSVRVAWSWRPRVARTLRRLAQDLDAGDRPG